jgi:hypothetical protein
MVAELGDLKEKGAFNRIGAEHLLGLVDAEIGWLERSLTIVAHADSQLPVSHDASRVADE